MKVTNERQMSRLCKMLCGATLVSLVAACAPADFQALPQGPQKTEVPGEPVPNPTPTPTPPPSVPTPTPTPVPPTPTPTPIPPTPPPTPTPEPRAIENFTQENNQVDILIIDDNSYSMDLQQQRMSERFVSLTQSLNGLDYNIGITTTDLDSLKFNLDGRMINWSGTSSIALSPATPNGDAVFKGTVKRQETIGCNLEKHECPSGNEQPMKAVVRAVEQRFTNNLGFFRNNVDLAVIVLSNEDELSNGKPTTGLDGTKLVATTSQQVLNSIDAAFQKTKRFAVHGIVIKPGDTKCFNEQKKQSKYANNANYAVQLTDLVTKTGGTTHSICDKDYTPSLTKISEQVRKLVGTFELHSKPKANSVQVVMTPAQSIPFRVEGKKVIFDTPPVAGTRIEISYVAQ